tara:strand:+ start:889 stop:1260 length:372 start_codon:yes stop_codon:yes gene_type:complete
MNTTESNFIELSKGLQKQIHALVDKSLTDIQRQMIPFINEDTEGNVRYRTNDVINQLIRGDFTVDDRHGCIYVEANECITIRLSSSDWNRAVDTLASRTSDKAKDLKIERLERQLKESYARSY